jgi:Zinc knuckle
MSERSPDGRIVTGKTLDRTPIKVNSRSQTRSGAIYNNQLEEDNTLLEELATTQLEAFRRNPDKSAGSFSDRTLTEQAQLDPTRKTLFSNESDTVTESTSTATWDTGSEHSPPLGLTSSTPIRGDSLPTPLEFFPNLNMAEEFNEDTFHRVIPEYGGDLKELNVFFKRGDLFYRRLSPAGRITFFESLAFKLKGKALGEYDRLPVASQTWEAFKAALSLKITGIKTLASLQAELMQMGQGRNQSVHSYAETINNKVQEMSDVTDGLHEELAVKGLFRTEHERMAVRVFKEGLWEPLRQRILATPPDATLEQLIHRAIEEEPFASGRTFFRNRNQPPRYEIPKRTTPGEEAKPGDTPAPKYTKGTCFKCGQLGHYANNCPVKTERVDTSNRSQYRRDVQPEVNPNRTNANTRFGGNNSNNAFRTPNVRNTRGYRSFVNPRGLAKNMNQGQANPKNGEDDSRDSVPWLSRPDPEEPSA